MLGYDTNEIVTIEKLSLNALSEVTEKLEQGNYIEADKQIEAIFIQDKIWDIRYVMYYLFSQLAQYKFDTYIQFCDQAKTLFSESYESISPIHRKEKVIQKAIDWFEKYFPEKFELALELFPNEQELENIVQNTVQFFDVVTAKRYVVEGVQQKLHKFLTILSASTKTNINEEVKAEEVIEDKSSEQKKVEDVAYDMSEDTENKASASTINCDTAVQGSSVEWQRLLTLLDDYKNYTENGHSEIAYLAHLKIEQALENFNPITYFPKVFEGYLRSKVHNYASLYKFKKQLIEQQPYANMVNDILENNDPALRKIICEKPFEYIEEAEDAVEEYMSEEI